jgi:hypothetical protein
LNTVTVTHCDVRVALMFNLLPCNKVLSSVHATYFLFLPSRIKANMKVYVRVCLCTCVFHHPSRTETTSPPYWAPRRLACAGKARLQFLGQTREMLRSYGARACHVGLVRVLRLGHEPRERMVQEPLSDDAARSLERKSS